MKVWSILQPNTLRADSLCALKNVKQRLQKEIHGWSSQSFPVTCCVFAEYQMRPNSDLLNMFVKILNWDKPKTILGGQRTYMTRSWLNISTFYSINLFIKLLINSVKVPSLCRGSGLMVRVSWAGLTQWIQSSRGTNHHNSWTVGDAPWQVIPCSHPGKRSVPWGGLVAFPQLFLVDWGEAQGKGGKQREIGSCPPRNSGSKTTWRGHQSSFSSWHQAPQAVHVLCANPQWWRHQTNICRRERDVEFLGTAACVGLVHAQNTVYVLLSIYSLTKN